MCYLFNFPVFQAAVWLRFGECLNALGELQAAAQAYESVVVLAPTHMEARVRLSALKQQLGDYDEALRVLDQGKLYRVNVIILIIITVILFCNVIVSQNILY